MTDRYANFAQSGPGRFLVRRLGRPDPPRLRRHKDGHTVEVSVTLMSEPT